MVKEKINNLVNAINSSNDPDKSNFLKTVEDFVNDCAGYVDKVVEMENAISIAKYRLDTEEYQEYVTNIDKIRRIEHNSIVVSAKLVDRLCNLFNVEEIFGGGPDKDYNRWAVAEFANLITNEYFSERKA